MQCQTLTRISQKKNIITNIKLARDGLPWHRRLNIIIINTKGKFQIRQLVIIIISAQSFYEYNNNLYIPVYWSPKNLSIHKMRSICQRLMLGGESGSDPDVLCAHRFFYFYRNMSIILSGIIIIITFICLIVVGKDIDDDNQSNY